MKARALGWLLFLALLRGSSCHTNPFRLEGTYLTAKEGSCVEIICKVIRRASVEDAHWFWMKDPIWIQKKGVFNASIIYSTSSRGHPVSPEFADRVKYTGSEPSTWGLSERERWCNISICDLRNTDAGIYALRYELQSKTKKTADLKWKSNNVTLAVEENPCLITFEQPAAVNESQNVALTCSTKRSCPSTPQITPSGKNPQGVEKTTIVTIVAGWEDDGKEFSCQTQANTDKNLIRKVSLTVEYSPKKTLATINNRRESNIVERNAVTLACSSKGRPEPSIKWFKDKQELSGSQLSFGSITAADSGNYSCVAQNKHGLMTSAIVIDVKYAPDVEVRQSPPEPAVRSGQSITLTCHVKRSNPPPHSYAWFRGSTLSDSVWSNQTIHVVRVGPEDAGSYTCRATNTVGTGKSNPFQMKVEYSPRNTRISMPASSERGVRVGARLTLTCSTEAYPAPDRYFWSRSVKGAQTYSSQKPLGSLEKWLVLERVQRQDEACYVCSANNSVGIGEGSQPECIQVLYPPTKLALHLDADVREGQLVDIRCTVDSFPSSHLTLTWVSTPDQRHREATASEVSSNTLHYRFNATVTHAGLYTCNAASSLGGSRSAPKEMVVRYSPKHVTVEAEPDLVVNEGSLLTLRCVAQAFPKLTSASWTKTADGKAEVLLRSQSFTLESVSPSDSGLYRCTASNEIGYGQSEPVEVKVKYAPKDVKITKGEERDLADGTAMVTLSCGGHSYPPVAQYSWYMKTRDGKEDVQVSSHQNHTVESEQPGVYYCVADNGVSQRRSDLVKLFLDRGLLKALRPILPCLFILLIVLIFVWACRHRRSKSVQQTAVNAAPPWGSFGLEAWRNSLSMGNLRSQRVSADPCRSIDDLLPDGRQRPNEQPCEPCPDSAASLDCLPVYSTVQPHFGNQGRSAPTPDSRQGGRTEDVVVDYASLHFGNKYAKAEVETVYAVVSHPKPPTKTYPEGLEHYENVGAAHAAAKSPKALGYDTDTSGDDDDVELSYTQVNFTPKKKPQIVERDSSDSSDSDEDT